MRISRSSRPPCSAGEALDALKIVRADVILLDVEMPGGERPRSAARHHPHGQGRARPDRLLDGRGRRRDDGAGARPGRRRYPAQARHRQFRRPLRPGAGRPPAPDRPRRARARLCRAGREAADPAARHGRRATGLRRPRRLDRRPPCPVRVPPAAAQEDRRADPRHPASAGVVHAPFRPPARQRLGPQGAGRRRRRARSRTISSTSRRATPISASSGAEDGVRVRLDRKRGAERLPALGRSDAEPRSARSMARPASA